MDKTDSEVIRESGSNYKELIEIHQLLPSGTPFVASLLDHFPGLAFPGGESFGQMVNRVVVAWEGLVDTAKKGTIILVSHGGTQAVILRHLQAHTLPRKRINHVFASASITEIKLIGNGSFQVIRENDQSHLDGLA